MDNVGWALWAPTIGMESSISDRTRAALAMGASRVTLAPHDVVEAIGAGLTAAELGRTFRDQGLDIVIDPVMNWHGGKVPEGRFWTVDIDTVLRMCDDLPIASLTAIGPFPPAVIPHDQLITEFASLCDRVADVGAQVHLEFIPFNMVNDLDYAWRVVSEADRANSGIIVDTWHFFRSTPDLELLKTIPGERILGVQVSDGPAESGGNPREEQANRLMPGDGSFDLVAVLRALDDIGGLHWVGPEVLSPVTAAMDAVDAALMGQQCVIDLIARARASTSTA